MEDFLISCAVSTVTQNPSDATVNSYANAKQKSYQQSAISRLFLGPVSQTFIDRLEDQIIDLSIRSRFSWQLSGLMS
jgi:hypothetical protein